MHNAVESIFEALNLKPEERFQLREAYGDYWVTHELRVMVQSTQEPSVATQITVTHLLDKRYTIVYSKDWRPQYRSVNYWYVNKEGLKCLVSNQFSEEDMMRIRLRNCYRDKEDITDSIITKWTDFYRSSAKIDWESSCEKTP